MDPTVIHVPAAPRGVEQAAAALHDFCTVHAIPPDESWRVKVSLDEALSNVVRHGSPNPKATIAVELKLAGGVLELTIADQGPPFDPIQAEAPTAAGLPIDTRTPGGHGLTIMKALLDEVRYERRGGANILVLRKRVTTE